MEILRAIFSIETVFFTVFDYNMSFIEFTGTIMGVASVWLATKANIHTWTTGVINVVAFFVIYYQIQLYSDMLLQIFFFVTCILGFRHWFKKESLNNEDKSISFLQKKQLILLSLTLIFFTWILGYFMSNIHTYFPNYFIQPASFPYADALTTVLSIYATFLMIYKKVECWILWILVDIISSILYFEKGVMFISIEYIIFLIIALNGLYQWVKIVNNEKRFSYW